MSSIFDGQQVPIVNLTAGKRKLKGCFVFLQFNIMVIFHTALIDKPICIKLSVI